MGDETGWDVVYSDGACKGNGQAGSIAGVGVWWAEGDPRSAESSSIQLKPCFTRPRNIAERCPGDQTNNRAELIVHPKPFCRHFTHHTPLQAILRVLETVPETKKPLLIKSDSSYSLKCGRSFGPCDILLTE